MWLDMANRIGGAVWFKDLFISCLKIGMLAPLIISFQNKLFEQMQGVPMGAACSPDIANLYAAFFEAKIFEHPHPRIPFYGRYIDDCLGIVYADSAEEALDIMSVVVIEDVQLEWSAS